MTDAEFEMDDVITDKRQLSVLEQMRWTKQHIEDMYGTIDHMTNSPPNTLHDMAQFLLIHVAGLDPNNPQEKDTPRRFLQMLRELTTPQTFQFTTFPTSMDEMIIESHIPFNSLCRHHLIPFNGVAHIGYVPNGTMAGLSKLARTVRFFAASLQTQEELTEGIAKFLVDKLSPKGVAVALEAEHMCMTIRGVKASGTKTFTQVMCGIFADHSRTAKAEFLARINGK